VQWCHLGDLRFTDPFFEQTVWRAMKHPFHLLFSHHTPLDALEDQTRELRLAGLIFHMSHCGSTLVSRMLAALDCNVVLSESAPLDRILKLPRLADVSEEQLVRWIRGVVAALSRKRHAAERNVFIKLDGWHVLLLPLFRRAFPDVPWVFLYRDPLEVLAALEVLRPGQTLPGAIDPALLGLDASSVAAMSVEAYGALMLERYCGIAIESHRDGGLLVEYRELPDAVCGKVLDHFGLHYGAAELAAMAAAAQFNAKNPAKRFQPDGETKRRNASERTHELARGLAPLYERLESLRLETAAR
jgi:hypothetical protein